ncbi:MAG: transporter substrate-binding domain-containing protein [Bacteroides sp.]|nr:transporter substrate-binding domain-containing protein [Prevotella sp.]MCM1408039.1 transporter substrate-binding domain-containing protein [Treponema brennaborense]MCM1469015.1 transporter substrate-binding domain-containing protein [Bacteroides sp.]
MKKICMHGFFCAGCRIPLICAAIITLFLSGCAKEKAVIACADDLAGKKIGVQAGTTGETYVQENVRGAKISSFKSGIDAALDLKTGAIDAVVLDELPAKEIAARNPELAIVRDSFAREEYAIAVKKGNSALLEIINNTIKEIKANGEYEKLIAAFMPADSNIIVPESEVLEGTDVIKLGTNAAFPPFEYVDGKTITGFDILTGQKIARSCGARLEVVDMSFDSLIPALQSGAIDFIAAGMSVSEERKKNVDFSVPYYESEQVIIIRKAKEK